MVKMLQKGWFNKLAWEESALYGKPAPGVRIQMLWALKITFILKDPVWEKSMMEKIMTEIVASISLQVDLLIRAANSGETRKPSSQKQFGLI